MALPERRGCAPHGFVADLGQPERDWLALRAALDHHYLNEIPRLERPSLEQVASWIWARLADAYPGLRRVEVQRRPSHHGCVCHGPANAARKRGS